MWTSHAAPCLQLGRPGVADLLLRPRVHGGTLAGFPRVAEAAPRDLLVEDRGDLRLLHAGSDLLPDEREDLLRLGDRGADAFDLEGRLAPPQRADDLRGRHEAIGVRRALQGLAQHEPHSVREPVRGRVAGRVVERDRLRVELFDRLTENGADALVVGDDVGVAPACTTPGASKRPTIAFRSPERERRNALCQVQCVPTISSMHGSGVTCVSWTNVSQRSMSCSSRIAGTWSSFSRMSIPSSVMAERCHTARLLGPGRFSMRGPVTIQPA